MRFALVVGSTRTARIPGLSAAGATPALARHTPAADAEILAYGRPVRAPVVPVSPTGCPTPAVVTRAISELVGFEPLIVDAGLATPTAAPTAAVGSTPGDDVRVSEPVPDAAAVFQAARELGQGLPGEDLWIGESIPGGTTTALGVLAALGESHGVSSSLPENPTELKRRVVAEGLAASEIARGDAAGDPIRAVALMGDPVLAAVMGLAAGHLDNGVAVNLAGGTQMVTVGALLRHAGLEDRIGVATTSFVAADDSADLHEATAALDLDLTVTDPAFDKGNHPAFAAFVRGEAKEGVGMGGALALADRAGVEMDIVRNRVVEVYNAVGGSDGS